MIRNTFVNGIQINSSKCFLQKLGNVAMAGVEFAQYQRGGVSGQVLSRPLYNGLAISMAWLVKGSDNDDFIAQRDRLIGYFQNLESASDYLKTLSFELSDGTIKEIDVLFSQVTGDLTPQNIANSFFDVSAISEREFFTNRTSKSAHVTISAGGGMAIPMAIPMSMAEGSFVDEAVLTNSGNANSYPIVTIHGGLTTSFSLINDTTGESLVYTGTLAADDVVVIDFYNRTAVLNGINSCLGAISGDWWKIAPGTNSIRLTSGSALDLGYADFVYKDSYRNI